MIGEREEVAWRCAECWFEAFFTLFTYFPDIQPMDAGSKGSAATSVGASCPEQPPSPGPAGFPARLEVNMTTV